MSHQKGRGGAWDHELELKNRTYEGRPEVERAFIGFRLVHADERRVYRGGSWNFTADLARAAIRDWDPPGYRFVSLGLRLVFDREKP